jgi:hypothetical protein
VRDPSRAVQWIGYHLGELAGVVVPAALAVTVSWWFALLAVLITAGWITHELRLHRHRRALTAAHRQALPGPDIASDTDLTDPKQAERRASR